MMPSLSTCTMRRPPTHILLVFQRVFYALVLDFTAFSLYMQYGPESESCIVMIKMEE